MWAGGRETTSEKWGPPLELRGPENVPSGRPMQGGLRPALLGAPRRTVPTGSPEAGGPLAHLQVTSSSGQGGTGWTPDTSAQDGERVIVPTH